MNTNYLPIIAITTAGLAGIWGASAAVSGDKASKAPLRAKAAGTPVLVELFTSEGCSSCPPADTLLKKLTEKQTVSGAHIIALSQHVDYWNRLGWADPFSSPAFTQRQEAYRQSFGNDSVYTPQMIVDGKAEFVGGDSNRAQPAIAAAAKKPKPAQVSLRQSGDKWTVQLSALPANALAPGDTADVYAAVAEDGLYSQVKSGENAGRKLDHAAVARTLTRIGSLKPGIPFEASAPLTLSPRWNKQALYLVGFVQSRKTHRILGVAEQKM